MTDFLLALVTDYGLYIITSVVLIGAIGIPMPSSVVALTSGGLAATGDFALTQVMLSIFLAFIVGDQIAFTLGGLAKPEWLERFRTSKRLGAFVSRTETLYEKHGLLAVFLSRTMISSIGPCIAYFCGIKKMKRARFTSIALIGAAVWTTTYVILGYTFAGNLPQMSNLVASFIMTGLAALFTIGFAAKLIFAWRQFEVVIDN